MSCIDYFNSLDLTLYNTLQKIQTVLEQETGERPALSTLWRWRQLRRMREEAPVLGPYLGPGKYVLTSAQYDTPVHEEFFKSLLTYCEANDARLLVAPVKYSIRTGGELCPEVLQYQQTTAVKLCPDLIFAADVHVLPTASRPLSGFHSYVQSGSGVLPHPKMHMDSLPRLKGEQPRFLYTTGSCTIQDYSDTKAGKIANFHHVLGALTVTVTDTEWFARQLIADDSGIFYDLDTKYTPDGFSTEHAAGIIWGDLHCEDLSDIMLETMVQINEELIPEYNICHDVLDFGGLSYHIKDNTPERARLFFSGSPKLKIDQSLSMVGTVLATMRGGTNNVIVVPSNHDDHLKRWLRSPIDASDFHNMWYWYQLNADWVQALSKQEHFPVLQRALEKVTLPQEHDIQFFTTDQSFKLYNIEVAQHGHSGPNGARGSSNNFRSIGSKIIIGHTHSAGIVDGVYTVGCMCNLDMGYNIGPSSWSHTFCIVYPNGKRSLVTIRNERRYK